MLTQAPRQIAKYAVVRALAAACKPVVAALEIATPIMADGSIHHRPPAGALKAHVITEIALLQDGTGGRAQIGFGRFGFYARMVEYGHRMIGHNPKKRSLGAVSPHPFMGPVVAETADAAVDAFAKSIADSLQEGIPGVPGRAA